VKLLVRRIGKERPVPRGKSVAPLNERAAKEQRDKLSKVRDSRNGSRTERTANKGSGRKK